MKNIYNEAHEVKVDGPDFKKLGYKITVLKPQGKNDEQFIKDKFRDEMPYLFELPDKTLVAKGGMYDEEVGDGNKDIENIGDEMKQIQQSANRLIVREALCKLNKIEHHIATMTMEGYSYREIQKILKISSKTIRKALDKINSIIQ